MTKFRTRAVRAGIDADPVKGSVVAPVAASSAYRREDLDVPGPYDYARTGQPGRALLADAIADLEGGAAGVICASGMAAIDLILNDLPNGARIVCTHDCYGGTRRLFDARAKQRGFDLVYADCTNLETLQSALGDTTDLAFFETPSNPRLRITDLKAASALAKQAGALVAVDNTVLSPALQRPLELGADIAMNSLTKLLNGHSDMIGGALACKHAEQAERLAWWANAAGASSGAFDAFLALRGIRTLPLRAKAQSESALQIAKTLSAHPKVIRVDYPGLETHPGHDVARQQQSGFGPLLSLELEGGVEDAKRFVAHLKLFILAQSLGGVESLCNIPATMTHAAMTPEARAEAGVSNALVRLSVGLEAVEDLIDDLQNALES
jgi:cystathionine gamma-synthase